MAKAKPITPIETIMKGINLKKSVNTVPSSLDLSVRSLMENVILQVNTYPTDVGAYWQEAQRDLYCCVDWIYRFLLDNFKYILVDWFNNLPERITKSFTMRTTFFKFGLAFNLGDFLRNYCFLDATNVMMEEKDDKVIISSQVYQMSLQDIENIFIEPRPKRW